MLYPNKSKTVFNKNITYGNRGMDLESLINKSNLYYLENDIALIYKKPTPIGISDVKYRNNKKIIDKAYFKEKSTLDYNGIYKGKYLDFDAKETKNRTSFPLNNLSKHQLNHIYKVLEHGGISFLIISINDIIYLLKGEDIKHYIENNNTKSIKYDYIKEKGIPIKLGLNPVLDYLNVINKIYFKEN